MRHTELTCAHEEGFVATLQLERGRDLAYLGDGVCAAQSVALHGAAANRVGSALGDRTITQLHIERGAADAPRLPRTTRGRGHHREAAAASETGVIAIKRTHAESRQDVPVGWGVMGGS